MHGNIPADPQRAIFPADKSDIHRRIADKSGSDDWKHWFSALARFISPNKPGAALQFLTGEDERSCHRYVAAQSEPKASVLVKLLQGSEGKRTLEFIMRGSDAEWWKQHKAAGAKADLIDGLKLSLQQMEMPLKHQEVGNDRGQR